MSDCRICKHRIRHPLAAFDLCFVKERIITEKDLKRDCPFFKEIERRTETDGKTEL